MSAQIGRWGFAGSEGVQRGITALALVVERQAKTNASSGAHRRNTPTPASPGSGPARISGTLVRSLTHTPTVAVGFDWQAKVGTAAGVTGPYSGVTAGTYGRYLDRDGLRNGTTYPFLTPAFKFAVTIALPTIRHNMKW
jgi:hypothetical protein